MYNSSFLGKVSWFVKRFGVLELVRKPVRQTFAERTIAKLKQYKFSYDRQRLEYVYHKYNTTWANERCVEVAIGLYLLNSFKGKRVLEIGNVMAHYTDTDHYAIDKYEQGRMVINEDIVKEYSEYAEYDLILSISTFEHIGFDELEGSVSDVLTAILNARSMLSSNGILVITVPIGYNPFLDLALSKYDNVLGYRDERYYVRTAFSSWCACNKVAALNTSYGSPFPYANGLAVLEFSKL